MKKFKKRIGDKLMSVEVTLYGIVGVKGNYHDFRFFKNKTDRGLEFEDLDKIKNVIYTDYLPNDYIYDYDGMGGDYSFIGKKVILEDELYNSIEKEFTPEMLQQLKKEVIEDFKNLNLDFKEEDVKLHIFTHFY